MFAFSKYHINRVKLRNIIDSTGCKRLYGSLVKLEDQGGKLRGNKRSYLTKWNSNYSNKQ